MKARMTNASKDYRTGKYLVSFEMDNLNEVEEFFDTDVNLELKKWSPKRSLDANAYFHLLVGKIADKVGQTKPATKNMLLARYGQREFDENGKPVRVSVLSEINLLEREDIHSVPIGYATIQGKEFTHYAILKPSHELDKTEFGILLNGTVDEAKELGISTITPDEIARMEANYKRG